MAFPWTKDSNSLLLKVSKPRKCSISTRDVELTLARSCTVLFCFFFLNGKRVKSPFSSFTAQARLSEGSGSHPFGMGSPREICHLAPGSVEGQELTLAGLSSFLYCISLWKPYAPFVSISRKEKRRRYGHETVTGEEKRNVGGQEENYTERTGMQGRECKLVQPLSKTIWKFLEKLKRSTT